MPYEKNFVISFVRHAESRGNAGLAYEHLFDRDDPPLSPKGLLQAEALAKSKFFARVDKIYASTLIRTVQTAYPTAVRNSKNIILLSDLMEVNTEIAGTPISLLQSDYPLAVPCTVEPTPTGGGLLLGAENTEDKTARAKRCMEYFYREAKEGDHIMVVTHGSYFGYLIREALGISLPESFCWQVDNCCVTRIVFQKDFIPKLSFANYSGHLDHITD